MKQSRISFEKEWNKFVERWQLDETKQQQFADYIEILSKANEKMSLTTITSPRRMVKEHFSDSLYLSSFIDMASIKGICDVGAGGGFPGLPLKIVFPHLHVVLIEVNKKKIAFLQELIERLNLEKCEVCAIDWRTFLRKTDYDIDLFCARASLQPEELIRMFKPSSPYKNAQLIYWASESWEPEKKVASWVQKEYAYHLGNKNRRLIFLGPSSIS